MASKTINRQRPVTYDVVGTPETIFHFPVSPSEPGKFDFYRVHLANNGNHSDTSFSDNSDVPTLSSTTSSTSSATKRRWTPFADFVSSNSNCSTISSSNDSSVGLNTNGIRTTSSFSTLTDAVKNAMSKGYLDIPSTTSGRPSSGTTLSSKDLNHLSPQSM